MDQNYVYIIIFLRNWMRRAMGNETFYRAGLRTFQPTRESEKKLDKSKRYYKETRISCPLCKAEHWLGNPTNR